MRRAATGLTAGLATGLAVGLVLAACGSGAPAKGRGQQAEQISAKDLFLAAPPIVVIPRVVAEYPHDPQAYTQGLLCYDGKLYESVGEYGRSAVRQVKLSTGGVLMQRELPQHLFGEGLALVGDSLLYQLTWNEQRCLVYRLDDFRQTGLFSYPGEGWGLTARGRHRSDSLYMSDGSSWIRVMDPVQFRQLRRFQVRDDRGEVLNINELEWVDGRLWANVYLTNRIAVIDPAAGAVTHYIDCSALLSRIRLTEQTDVLNGIAVDERGRIFVTGKRWNKLFEIEVVL